MKLFKIKLHEDDEGSMWQLEYTLLWFLFMSANKLRSVRCSGLDLRLRPTVILALMIHSVLKGNEGSCEGPTTRPTWEQ
ncbi:uncharacterized [Tachysurus ichikawai]